MLPRSRPVAVREPPKETAAAPKQTATTDEGQLKPSDIDAAIMREERAARLAASARILASQPGLEEASAQALDYLSSRFGDTRSYQELTRTLGKNGG